MRLYLITQTEARGYDTYDSAVVAAPDAATARSIHPNGGNWEPFYSSWCRSPDKVTSEYLGEAVEGTQQGVICSSFNAG